MYAKFEGKVIFDVEHLYEFVLEYDLDVYNGGIDKKNYAYLSSKSNPDIKIEIKYSNAYECKAFETMVKPIAVMYKPRKFEYDKKETIAISPQLKKELSKIANPKIGYENIIWKLLLRYNGVV